MTFPSTPLAAKHEIQVNGVWTDITSYVYQRNNTVITRGRQSENQTAQPSTATFTLDNRDGRFSPKNPIGAYYGGIGRNTPYRVSLPPIDTGCCYVTGQPNSGVTTPDAAGLDIVGDIDIRFDADLTDWAGAQTSNGSGLIGKYDNVTGNNRSWVLVMSPDRTLVLWWSADGTAVVRVNSTIPVPYPFSGRKAIRATLDVNNGAGGNTVTFYTSDTIAGSWTQLGSSVVTAGVTSIFNSTASLFIGDAYNISSFVHYGVAMKVYAAQVLNGIAGAAVANPDFTAQADGTTSFADAASNTWTLSALGSAVVHRDYRFYGEISEWPTSWDITGNDSWVDITASDINRRLNAGTKALNSSYYTAATSVQNFPGLVAYWPFEDSVGSTLFASGFPNGIPANFPAVNAPTLSTDTSFACSKPLPTFNAAGVVTQVAAYASTGYLNITMLFKTPAVTATGRIFTVVTGGTAARFDVSADAAGNLYVTASDRLGANILTTGALAFAINGATIALSLKLTNVGSDINWMVGTQDANTGLSASSSSTLAGYQIGSTAGLLVNPVGVCVGSVFGHITVQNSPVFTPFTYALLLRAWATESASNRYNRLTYGSGVSAWLNGTTLRSSPMGVQAIDTLAASMQDIESTDGGMLYSMRQFFGLAYKPREALEYQSPAISLSWTSHDPSDFVPVADDLNVTNDVTVSRVNGSSARAQITSGSMSVNAPPNGIGDYASSITINTAGDAELLDQAAWRAHISTADSYRFPQFTINLARSNFINNSTLNNAVVDLDIGDVVTVANPPAQLVPDNIDGIVIGYTETLNAFVRTISYVLSPAEPWHVGRYLAADGTSTSDRYTSNGSTLNGSHTSGTALLSVSTPVGPLWGINDGPYDIIVGGERMTVTDVSGPPSDFLSETTTTFESGISNWTTAGNCSIAQSAAKAHSGTHSLSLTSTAGGTMNAAHCSSASILTNGMTCSPGDVCMASVWILTAVSARTTGVGISWYDSGGAFLSTAYGTTAADGTSTWVKVQALLTAPASAAKCRLIIEVLSTGGASEVHYVDDVFLGNQTTGGTILQTFIVTRSVNGISKAHSSGETVELFTPVYYGIGSY